MVPEKKDLAKSNEGGAVHPAAELAGHARRRSIEMENRAVVNAKIIF